MAKLNHIKIGIGAGAVLLGAYIAISSLGSIIEVVIGIVIAAFGISMIAWS